ncbi:S9 family peptidase [Pararhizobium sp. IMCC21322]|uniref:alpha/beta hydrolase family protein n=1 Tax=Pararhizobium sp. IMCC21322 TaxID=3067903 RepID=UPI0027404001|nr:alpha/beta hydrolase [Pararhizobium sp. IMCC21322]
MLKRGREHKAKTGESMKVQRFDIVPIPTHMRDQLPDDAIMEFPVDTAESICSFMPINFVGKLAPRPLLLMHAATDAVTPTDSTLEVFQHANLPKDLVLLSGLDHFPLGTADKRLYNVLRVWLVFHFALK